MNGKFSLAQIFRNAGPGRFTFSVFFLFLVIAFVFSSNASAQPNLSLTGISPNLSGTSGNSTVTIAGSGFVPGMQVWFGAVQGEVVGVSDNALQVITPAHVAGAVRVSVSNDDASAKTGYIFTFVEGALPAQPVSDDGTNP